MSAPGEHPPPENGGHYLSPFDQNPPPYTSSPPTAPRRRRGRVVALVVTGVVVAAAATGATVFLTRSHTTPQAGAGGGAAPAPAPAPASYPSFEAEYPATKGAIARISTIGWRRAGQSFVAGGGHRTDPGRHVEPRRASMGAVLGPAAFGVVAGHVSYLAACNGSAYVGTGFAIDAHHIVTAGHVVDGSTTMSVTLDGNPVPTQIIGLDASGDVALLQSDNALPAPYIPLADSAPAVGERVAAIGFPLGAGLTLTQGSVSALGQDLTVNNNHLAGLVQTDTALNPGNSGGPLIALDGTARGIVDALNTRPTPRDTRSHRSTRIRRSSAGSPPPKATHFRCATPQAPTSPPEYLHHRRSRPRPHPVHQAQTECRSPKAPHRRRPQPFWPSLSATTTPSTPTTTTPGPRR